MTDESESRRIGESGKIISSINLFNRKEGAEATKGWYLSVLRFLCVLCGYYSGGQLS